MENIFLGLVSGFVLVISCCTSYYLGLTNIRKVKKPKILQTKAEKAVTEKEEEDQKKYEEEIEAINEILSYGGENKK